MPKRNRAPHVAMGRSMSFHHLACLGDLPILSKPVEYGTTLRQRVNRTLCAKTGAFLRYVSFSKVLVAKECAGFNMAKDYRHEAGTYSLHLHPLHHS